MVLTDSSLHLSQHNTQHNTIFVVVVELIVVVVDSSVERDSVCIGLVIHRQSRKIEDSNQVCMVSRITCKTRRAFPPFEKEADESPAEKSRTISQKKSALSRLSLPLLLQPWPSLNPKPQKKKTAR
jgi:hypothetical protein